MTDLTCDITYAVDQSDPDGAPYTFCKLLGTDTHLKVKPIPTLVKDIRPAFEQGEGPKLGVEGFEAVRHVYEGELDGDQGWENIYARKMAQWLQTHLGATRVAQYGATMRRRIAEDDPAHPKEFDTGKLQPATVAHCDGSQFSANKRARDTLGLSEEEAKGKRIAIINVWRPLAGPVVDSPLALCDARTVVEEDYTITHDFYGQGSFLKQSNRHKFHYLRDQTPAEVLLLRCFDSTLGVNEGGTTPHTAIFDEDRKNLGLRQSVEVRCAVLY